MLLKHKPKHTDHASPTPQMIILGKGIPTTHDKGSNINFYLRYRLMDDKTKSSMETEEKCSTSLIITVKKKIQQATILPFSNEKGKFNFRK